MGAGSINAPANQPPNSNSGAASPADTVATAEFGQVLEQERLCPEGLHRPSRHDAPCTYLRPPSIPTQPDKPVNTHYEGNPDDLKGPMTNRQTGPDYWKPIPPSHEKEIKPPPVYHTGGMGSLDGAHIVGVEKQI